MWANLASISLTSVRQPDLSKNILLTELFLYYYIKRLPIPSVNSALYEENMNPNHQKWRYTQTPDLAGNLSVLEAEIEFAKDLHSLA